MIVDSIRGAAKAADHGKVVASPIPHKRVLAAIAYVALTVAALWPVFATSYPPLIDLPNHLARIHILGNIADDPVLQANYRVEWGIMPNLAMDALLTPLAGAIGIWEAGRLFVALTMLTLIGGTLTLHRVLHGRIGLWPAAVFLVLFNHALIWGLLGFLFSLGLALFAFAGWVGMRDRPWRWRLPMFAAVATGLFFMHLLGLATYGLLVAAWEFHRGLQRPRDWRRAMREWSLGAAQFAPAFGFLIIAATKAPGKFMVDYGGLAAKLLAILAPAMAYIDPLDGVMLAFLYGAVLYGLLSRRLRRHPGTGLTLAILAGLTIVFPAWMNGALGAAWGMDLRLSVILGFVAVAVLRLEPRSQRAAITLGALGLILFAARVVTVTGAWTYYDRQYTEFRDAVGAIEPGAAIFQAQTDDVNRDIPEGKLPQAYWHLVTQAIVTSGAFVPTLFTDPTKQPVQPAQNRVLIDTPYGKPAEKSDLANWTDPARFPEDEPIVDESGMRHYEAMWQDRFDYVVVLHQGDKSNPAPEFLSVFVQGSFFDIYRVTHGAPATPAQ